MAWSAGPQAAWVAEANRGERPELQPTPGPFNAATLIEDAVERAGNARRFADASIGDPSFTEPLEVFCDALETTAELTALGRWATQRYLKRLIDVRLELEAHESAHRELRVPEPTAPEPNGPEPGRPEPNGPEPGRPEPDGPEPDRPEPNGPEPDSPAIVEPIFVIGPPRSGTTVLHRHLGALAGHRVARGWEFTRPLPPPTPETYDQDPRILQTVEELEFPQAVAAGLRSIHTYSAQMPKECLSAMAFTARTEEFISRYNVPAYVEWLRECDMTPAYAMHRRILRILQLHMPSKRWVLKSPVHLQSVPALVATYPDASFIVTHREPTDILASVSSLVATMRSAFSNKVDPVAIGRYHHDLYRRSLNALVDHVDKGVLPAQRTIHVAFKDLVADTPATVAAVCQQLGIDTAASRQAGSIVAKEVREDSAGAHRYQPSDFGLDRAQVARSFDHYRARFL